MILINHLFSNSRLPSGWRLIPLFIYLPLGLVLATVRFFIGFEVLLAAWLVHELSSFRTVVLRTMCTILGIIIYQENKEARDDSAKVIVSNHISILDHLVIHLLTGSTSTNFSEVPSLFHFPFYYKNLGSTNKEETLVQNVKHAIDSGVTVDVQPENAMTSGQKGLLRFSTWPCRLSRPIQPVSIRIIDRPLTGFPPSVISSHWSSDLFWFLFAPLTVFSVKYLPVVHRAENETEEEMTRRIESVIAEDLKISTTNFTAADKSELVKRLEAEWSVTRPAKADSSIVQHARVVKEILPDVPFKTIYAELVKNRSIETTIALFTEGLVHYEPENPTTTRSPRTPRARERKSALEASQPSTSTRANLKSTRESMISFQERKMRFIENARQRYIEKHALNIMNSS